MKVLIELPDNWFDAESPLGLASYSIRQMAEKVLREAFEEHIIAHTKIPKIKISANELKQKVLEEMAKRAIDKCCVNHTG